MKFTEGLNYEERCACANCSWRGYVFELKDISDLDQRVRAGEVVPAGECPKCGCLAHVLR